MDNIEISEKSRTVALLLAIFLGGLGIHRFYAGKIGSGVAQLFFGFATLFIWNLVDLIMIAAGSFKDADGKVISKW